MKALKFTFLLASILLTINCLGEGTKELQPTVNTGGGNFTGQGYLMLYPRYSDFARYGADSLDRLYFTICDPTEAVYFGFRRSNSDNNASLQVRVRRDSDDGIVFPETNVPTADGNAGYIASFNEAVAGPTQVAGPGGYDAMTIPSGSLTPGDYYIEFNTNDNRFTFEYFDVTVTDQTNNPITGRLWSRHWLVNTTSFTDAFYGTMYIYSDDGIVTSLDFNGIEPYVFNIAANAQGTRTLPGFYESSQSLFETKIAFPQYRIFLNPPSETCFPSGDFGELTGPVTIDGCTEDKCINIPVDQAGKVIVLLDLNGIPGYQPNSADVQKFVDVVVGLNCIPWDTRDGFGNLIPPGQNISLQIDYLNGITHLPLYDVERHRNGYTVQLVRPAHPDPAFVKPVLFWDDTLITPQNPNSQIPGHVQTDITGCSSISCHEWLSSNNFDNGQGDYGNLNTINTWWYANIITEVSGYIVETTIVDADTRIPGRGSDGGNDTTICTNSGSFQLAGSISLGIGGTWSSSSGNTAGFSDTRDLLGTYTPSAQDYTNGTVTLTLTSDATTSCATDQDFLVLNLNPGPSLNIGPGDTLCENNSNVVIGASFSFADGILWTGGNGTFVPNRTTAAATYNPTQTEIDSGFVRLTMCSENTTNICPDECDSVDFYFNKAPVLDLSSTPQTLCATAPSVDLVATIENAGGGTWIGGLGTFSPSRDSLTTQYNPTPNERQNGVTLTLSSTQEAASCNPETEDITITFSDGSTVNINSPVIQACATADTIQLSGTSTGSPTIKWTGGAGSFIPSDTIINPMYVVNSTDTTNGSVTLVVETDGSDGCSLVRDSVTIEFTSPPTVAVDASNLTSCANNPNVTLSGSFSNATGITWIGNGGNFSPSADSLTTVYIPSQNEISGISTFITLTSDNVNSCQPATDVVNLLIIPTQTADANGPYSLCENSPSVTLGATTNASGYWTGGEGIFDDSTLTNATYTASANEIAMGLPITLTFNAVKNLCNPITDDAIVTIEQAPIVNAGPPQSVCENNAVAQLNGSFSNATQATWSSASGNNAGFSSTTDVGATYTPSATEIANGTATLILTSSAGTGTCLAEDSSVIITIDPAPIVNPGGPYSVCRNNALVQLNATITNATGGVWSGGNRNVRPNATRLDGTYNPNRSEKDNGGLTLTLTSTGNGNCNAVSADVFIEITDRPRITGFGNSTVCADAPDVTYSANVTVAAGGKWTGGQGTYTPNDSSLNFTYTPSINEINAGSVDLTLTTTDNANCDASDRTRTITIDPAPIISAGSDQIICGDVTTVSLNGSITNAGGSTWQTLGTPGTFADATSAITTYTPSAQDKLDGEVELVITSNNEGLCTTVTDTMKITFTEVPSAEAGNSRSLCSTEFPIQLNGSGSTGAWVGGLGTFSPDRTILNATYTPTPGEVTTGSVTLTYQTNLTGACPQVSDDVTYSLQEGPTIDPGNDLLLCGNVTSIPLSATIQNAGNAFWTTTASGSFTPSASNTSPSYGVHASDTSMTDTSSIVLHVATTGNLGCPPASDSLIIQFVPAPILVANPVQILCADGSDINLSGAATNVASVVWNGGNGGTYSPVSKDSLPTSYTPSAFDLTQASINFVLSAPAGTTCPAVSDTTIVSFVQPLTVEAGPSHIICADSNFISLNASTSDTTSGIWTTSGTGTFSLTAADTISQYFPSVADTALGQIILTFTTQGSGICADVSDSLVLDITPAPQVSVGNDTTVCGDSAPITLSGFDNGVAGGVEWSTSGNGNFSNINDPNATYSLSQDDIDNTIVTLTLSTTGSGDCGEVSSSFNISILAIPVIDAGLPRDICVTDTSVALTASIQNAGGVAWSSPTGGTFSEDSLLTTVYFPTTADTTNKTVDLIATSTQNGICNTYTDTVTVNFQVLPTVLAGPDQTVCGDAGLVTMAGTVTGAGGGSWESTGDGNFSPNFADLNANYQLTTNDTTAGTLNFILTSTASGACPDQTDTMSLVITDVPIVTAGNDTTVCAQIDSIALIGNIITASGGKWLTSGTGTFSPNDSSLTAYYIPSINDTASRMVTITLVSSDNGTCNPVSDDFIINFTPAAVANAGADLSICADSGGVQVNSNIAQFSSLVWRTSGSGVFGPDTTVTQPIYYPSASDTANGNVTLTVIAQGNGTCASATSSTIINIIPEVQISVSNDETICAETLSFPISATTQNSTGGQWSTTTPGSFSSSVFDLTPDFHPASTNTDTSYYLTFTTSQNGICPAKSDSLLVSVIPSPIVSAGNDFTECADAEFIDLSGSVQFATGSFWTTSGTGQFLPDSSQIDVTYVLSPSDVLLDSVVISLTSMDTSSCTPVSDNLVISLTPIPTLDAGSNITVCPGTPSVDLQGTVTVATGGFWNTNGTGTFTDPSQLITTYNIDPLEAVDGNSITLELESTGNGQCLDYSEEIILSFTNTFVINAGPTDTTVCDTDLPVPLNGNGAQGEWTHALGLPGLFTPNAQTLDAVYEPTAADLTAGFVKLYLTTTNIGSCTPQQDSLTINFINGPSVTAGPDLIICTNETEFTLAGTRTNSATSIWTTSGSGKFDNLTRLDPIYTFSDADLTLSNLTFTLISTDNGQCNAAQDLFTLSIEQGPNVNPGPGLELCATATEINLAGSFQNATNAIWSGGSNNFLASNTDMNARYQVQASDTSTGSVTITLTSQGHPNCNPDSKDVVFTFAKSPTAEAGPPQAICTNVSTISLVGNAENMSSVKWETTGTGQMSPSSVQDSIGYVLSANDTTLSSLRFYYRAIPSNICPEARDSVDLTITPAPTVEAGPLLSACENSPLVPLSGTLTNATTFNWSASGNGSFNPNNTTLGASYEPDSIDIIAGAVNIQLTATEPNCNPVSDFTTLSFIDFPSSSVNAGVDISTCKDVREIPLQGVISSATSGKWSTSGSGDFLPNDSALTVTYIPSSTDTSSASIQIRLTAQGNSTCGEVTDSITVSFTDKPTANLGGNITVCEDTSFIPLNASITVAQGIAWSTSGSGTFSTSAFDTTTAYVPSPADITAGNIVLSVNTTGNGTCQAITESISLTITPSPSITAGNAIHTCDNTSDVAITSSIQVATQGTWTTSGNGTFTDENALNTSYQPSTDDTNNGMIVLTIESVDHGQCQAVNDQLVLTFETSPTVEAGNTQTICEDEPSVNITGNASDQTSLLWTTNGGGSFTNASSAITSYNLAPTDQNLSTIELYLTAAGNANCSSIVDTVIINLLDAPLADATAGGLCELSNGAQLTGTVTRATGGIWSSAGTGSFSPNTTDLNGNYFPSIPDTQNDEVAITLTTTGNGLCQAVSANAAVVIEPIPTADAGNDQTVCRGSTVSFAATIEEDINYEWQTTDGTVISNSSTLSVTVTSDTTFVLFASRDDGCSSSDNVSVNVYDLPSIAIDTHFCFIDTLILNATVTNMPNVPGEFQWFRNGVIVQGERNTSIIPQNTGTYSLVFAYGNCSIDTATKITPLPDFTVEDAIGCKFDSTTIQASVISNATYTWTLAANSLGTGNPINVATPTDSATYAVEVTNLLGCMDSDSLEVKGVDRPIFSLSDSVACDGDTLGLSSLPDNIADLSGFQLEYSWKLNGSLLSNTTSTITANSTGEYIGLVTIDQCVGTDTSNFALNSSPVPGLPDNLKMCLFKNETATLTPSEGATFLWSTGETTPSITVADTGTYIVLVTNEFMCSALDTVSISDLCEPEVFVPSAFTPGSGNLDQFYSIFGHHFRNFKMTIYNRWGEVIYYTEDPEQPWDGYYRGELMPVGVYPWLIEFEGFEDFSGKQLLEGSVTLVR